MTSDDLSRIREDFALDRAGFAALLGVSVSTVYRWDAVRGTVRIDPMQRKILMVLDGLLRSCSDEEIDGLRAAVVHGMNTRGGLYALFLVLDAFYRKAVPR